MFHVAEASLLPIVIIGKMSTSLYVFSLVNKTYKIKKDTLFAFGFQDKMCFTSIA